MDSIAITKPDMGTLSRKRLVLSPFGALSQAFTQELLARAGFEEGHWPFVPLDLLEEGPFDVPSPPVQPIVQVDLSLILQAVRQSESRTERTVERIIERIIRLREQGSRGAAPVQTVLRDRSRREAVRPAVQKVQQETTRQVVQSLTQETDHQIAQALNQRASSLQAVQSLKQGGEQGAVQIHELPASVTGPFAYQQHFYSTVNQHINFITNIRQAGLDQQPDHPLARRAILGSVSRHSLEFFRQLLILRRAKENPLALSANPGDVRLLSQPTATWFPDIWAALDLPGRQGRASGEYGFAKRDGEYMSPEELSHLRDEGGSVSFNLADAEAVIHRSAQRAIRQLSWAHMIRAIHLGAVSQPTAPEGQTAVPGRPGQKPVAHPTAREPRWLPRHGFEYTPLQDRGTTDVSSDGLYMVRALEPAGQIGRTAGHRSLSDPSRAVHSQAELLLRGDSGATEERQRPGIDAKAAITEHANRTQVSRQKGRFDPEGAAAGQRDYLLTPASQDVRLTGRGFRQLEMEGEEILASPQERLAFAFQLDEELAHKLEKGNLSEYAAAAADSLGQEVHRRKTIASTASRVEPRGSLPKGSQVGSRPGFQTSSTAQDQVIPTAEAQTAYAASGQSFLRGKAVGRGKSEFEGLSPVLEELPYHRRQTERNTAAPDTASHVEGLAMYSAQLLAPSIWDVRFTRQEIAGYKTQVNAMAQVDFPDLSLSVPEAEPTDRAGSRQRGSLVWSDRTKNSEDTALFAPVDELLYRGGPEQGDAPDLAGRSMAGIQAVAAQKTQPVGPEFRPGTLHRRLFAGSAAESMGQVEDFSALGRAVPAISAQRYVLEPALRDVRLSTAEQGSIAEGKTVQGERIAAPHEKVLPLAEIKYQIQHTDEPSATSQGERISSQLPSHTTRAVRDRPVKKRTTQAIPSQSADLKMFHAALPADVDQRLRERPAGQVKPMSLLNPVIRSDQFAGRANAVAEQTSTLSSRTDRSSAMALDPLELEYGTQAQSPDASPAVPAARGQTTAGGLADSDYIRSLPDWARRFLQEGAPQTREEAVQRMGTAQRLETGQAMASARNIAALSFPAGEAFEWTAPDYRAPAPVEYRERPQRKEQSQPQSAYISDAEIQRTADRVYQIIEERIRRERHRMGL